MKFAKLLLMLGVVTSTTVVAENGEFIGIDGCLLKFKITSNGLGNLGTGYVNLKNIDSVEDMSGDIKLLLARDMVTLQNDSNRLDEIVSTVKKCSTY